MVKISRPTPRDVHQRLRLFKRLDDLRRFPVIWVSAPAGSGKTTLISSYVGDRDIPCLWYQIDRGDADPATFFYYMREAAKKAMPKKHLTLPLLTPEYDSGVSTFAYRFFKRLCDRMSVPFLMIFDNYQDLPRESPLHGALNESLSAIPDGINAVIISRNEPPSFLSRSRADCSVGFMGWRDIRLTEAEAYGIMGCNGDTPPEQGTMSLLYRLSDGWAAGVILLVEGCRNGAQIPKLAGKGVFDKVFKYLAEEIFMHLDAATREFFLATAFFPRMTVSMAEELTGNRDAGRMLSAMNRNNFFIIRHSGSRVVYEYHPLCRHFLRNRAKTEFSPERLTAVRRAAALILERSGMTEAAVILLKDAADWDEMTRIIDAHAQDMIKQGRHRMLQAWCAGIPSTEKEKTPRILCWEGMSLLPFSPDHARSAFERSYAGFQDFGDDVGAMLAASGVINAVALGFNDFSPLDHWYGLLNDLARETTRFPDTETEAFVIAGIIAASVMREIYPGGTEALVSLALNITEVPSALIIKAQALRFIFWRRLLWDGIRGALPILYELRRLSCLRPANPWISIIVRSAEVQYHLYSGSHDELIDAARDGLSISKETGIHLEDLWFYIHTAASFINRMDCEAGREWLDMMPFSAEDSPNWVKNIYHMQLMRINLINEELDHARYEGKISLDFAVRSGSGIAIAGSQLLLAQLYQTTGRHEDALNLLEHVLAYAEAKGSKPMEIAVLRNEAQLAFDTGNNRKGLLLLEKSLKMARECGCLFTTFDNPAVTTSLCEKALEAGIETDHAREIIRKRGLVPKRSPVHIEGWPWPLKIYTLGRFSIVRDGEPIRFSGKAQQTPLRLLKALIALGGREIAEVAISELIWPSVEGDLAHQSFETNLHRLRRLVGYGEALRLSDGRITLDNRHCWVDAWAFERLMAQSDAYEQQGMKNEAWETGEKGLSLYRHDFLNGDIHETWVISPSERLKAKYFNKLLRLGRSLEIAEQEERAVLLYERGLEINDKMEEIYQRLMECLMRLKKTGEALAAYDRCRNVLASSLGIDPSRETEAIRAAILSKRGISGAGKGKFVP